MASDAGHNKWSSPTRNSPYTVDNGNNKEVTGICSLFLN